MALDTSIYGNYIKTGLDKASGLVNRSTPKAYTPYTSSAANAPAQTQMYDYTQSSPLQQINAPNYTLSAGNAPTYQQSGNYQIAPQAAQWNNYNASAYGRAAPTAQTINPTGRWSSFNYQKLGGATPTYQGLMGGDYDALQNALMQPGQQQATNAYNTGTQNLINAMGGRGLYGSSIMAQQQIQGLDREYMNALATNASAAAQGRYGAQQQDLMKSADIDMAGYQQLMGENTTAQQLLAQQNLARNEADQQNLNRSLQQTTNLNELANNQYLARMNENQALQQLMMNQNLARNAQGMQQAELTQQGLLANAQNSMTADKSRNDFGLNLYAQKLAEQQNQNAFNLEKTAGLRDQALNTANVAFTQADSMNQYNNLKYNAQKEYETNLNNWKNQQNYEKNFVYPQAKSAWDQAQQEQMINQALALAGQGAPLATAASNQELQSAQLAAQQAAAQQNYNAQLWGSAAGALGSLGSGLLSSAAKQPTSTTWNNLWS